ncbi:MAG: hypothetical protein B6242_04245, partial [Anaerolineaceae bacterium 4572_78]
MPINSDYYENMFEQEDISCRQQRRGSPNQENDYERETVSTSNHERKLKVDELKEKAVYFFSAGETRKAWLHIRGLQEYQKNDLTRLAMSLCSIAKEVHDDQIKLDLLEEALDANPYDT